MELCSPAGGWCSEELENLFQVGACSLLAVSMASASSFCPSKRRHPDIKFYSGRAFGGRSYTGRGSRQKAPQLVASFQWPRQPTAYCPPSPNAGEHAGASARNRLHRGPDLAFGASGVSGAARAPSPAFPPREPRRALALTMPSHRAFVERWLNSWLNCTTHKL